MGGQGGDGQTEDTQCQQCGWRMTCPPRACMLRLHLQCIVRQVLRKLFHHKGSGHFMDWTTAEFTAEWIFRSWEYLAGDSGSLGCYTFRDILKCVCMSSLCVCVCTGMPAISRCVLRSEDNLSYHAILVFYTSSNLRSRVIVSQEAESTDSGQKSPRTLTLETAASCQHCLSHRSSSAGKSHGAIVV